MIRASSQGHCLCEGKESTTWQSEFYLLWTFRRKGANITLERQQHSGHLCTLMTGSVWARSMEVVCAADYCV